MEPGDYSGKELIRGGITTDADGKPIKAQKVYREAYFSEELNRPEFIKSGKLSTLEKEMRDEARKAARAHGRRHSPFPPP